jgi:hypothetical protein
MKKILKTLFLLPLFFTLPGLTHAQSLDIRIKELPSATNKNDFRVDFVTLDMQSRSVTVDCYFKRPSDSFQLFQTISLANGGDSGFCQVTSTQITERGVYDFYVVANAGSDSKTSPTVQIEYDDTAPDAPSYTKETQPDGCSYKIVFKTANDEQTSRVELYRSQDPNFTADANSRIDSQGIGPDQEGVFYTTLPDCGKSYYFAIRAFDGHQNGSGIVGDTSTIQEPSDTQEDSDQAIATTQTSLDAADSLTGGVGTKDSAQGQGDILGKEQIDPTQLDQIQKEGEFSWTKIILLGAGILIVGGIIYFAFIRKNES